MTDERVCRICGGNEEPPVHNAKCVSRGHDYDDCIYCAGTGRSHLGKDEHGYEWRLSEGVCAACGGTGRDTGVLDADVSTC